MLSSDGVLQEQNDYYAFGMRQQRGDYPTRREFQAFTIRTQRVEEKTLEKLELLGFNVS